MWGLKPFPTGKDIYNSSEEDVIFNRKTSTVKVDANFSLGQDLTWEDDNDREDDVVNPHLLQENSYNICKAIFNVYMLF